MAGLWRSSLVAAALALAGLLPAAQPVAAFELSHRFTGNQTGEVRAVAVGAQEFSFGPFQITCLKARASKTLIATAFPSQTVDVAVLFGKCTSEPVTVAKKKLPAAKAVFLSPLNIDFHANRWAEIGAEDEGGEVTGTVEIDAGGGNGCMISWGPQTVPAGQLKEPNIEYEAALYETLREKVEGKKKFPLGVRERLLVTSTFSKMTFSLAKGACAQLSRTELKTGEYEGALRAEVGQADLGWE